MAEFCLQCARTMFGPTVASDFAGLARKSTLIEVLCEGCGPIQVDNAGACRSDDCLEKHGEQGVGVRR